MADTTVTTSVTGLTRAHCAFNIERAVKLLSSPLSCGGSSEARVDEVFAEALPEEKSLKVKQLQEKGNKAGIVGDGINDAPAQTDVGSPIGTGTDIAAESGNVILARGNLMGVPWASF